jgi:hypothetical protein
MDSSTTTRISELPENASMQQPIQQQQQQQQQQFQSAPNNIQSNFPPTISITQTKTNQLDSQDTNYLPINIHPNPYGSPSPQQQQTPQPQQYISSMVPPQYHQQLSQIPQQRLSSRDIPMDTIHYTHDEEIQPNYIPKSSVNNDYVREYESTTEKNMREYEQKKRDMNNLDYWTSEFQFPITIAILFFSFQLPIVNTLLYKNFSGLGIFREDGNLNFYGLVSKSILFGISIYMIGKMGS